MTSTISSETRPTVVREDTTYEVQYRISPTGKWLRHLNLRPKTAEEALGIAKEYAAETGCATRAARRNRRITTETVVDVLAP